MPYFIIPLIILIGCVCVFALNDELISFKFNGNYMIYLIRKIQRIVYPFIAIFLWVFIIQTIDFYRHFFITFSWIDEYKNTYAFMVVVLIPILYILFYRPMKNNKKYRTYFFYKYYNNEILGRSILTTSLIPSKDITEYSIMKYTITLYPDGDFKLLKCNTIEISLGYSERNGLTTHHYEKLKLQLYMNKFSEKSHKKNFPHYKYSDTIRVDSDTYNMFINARINLRYIDFDTEGYLENKQNMKILWTQ